MPLVFLILLFFVCLLPIDRSQVRVCDPVRTHPAPNSISIQPNMAGTLKNVVVIGGSYVGLVSVNATEAIEPDADCLLQAAAKELATSLPATHRVS